MSDRIIDRYMQRYLIKADPGWFVAIWIEAGKDAETGESWDDYLSERPIIAWAITWTDESYHPSVQRPSWDRCIQHDVEPVTVNGNISGTGNRWCIEQPDGQYIAQCEIGPIDEAEMIEYFKEAER
jgi:hypothetical protein